MKAKESTLLDLLDVRRQYVIPVFQRYYTWDKKDWQKLWDDINGLLEPQDVVGPERRHFVGAIVSITHQVAMTEVPRVLVIDGQQRLMTLTLLLCAIRDAARIHNWSRIANTIDGRYILHSDRTGDSRYRLFPRMRDRQAFLGVVTCTNKDETSRVFRAYEFFSRELKRSEPGLLASERRVESLVEAIVNRLDFVSVALDGENPYAIFQSLNSTGVRLEESDLIRNHVFMELRVEDEDEFDDAKWQPLEEHFCDKEGHPSSGLLADFFRECLMRRGEYVAERGVYVAFRRHHRTGKFQPEDVVQSFDALVRLYDIMRGVAAHAVPGIERALQDVRSLKIVSTNTLVLRLLELHAESNLSDDEIVAALRALTSFVVRRGIMKETTRFLGAWFCAACKELGDSPVTNLRAFLVKKGWPSDTEVLRNFQEMDLHKSPSRDGILTGLERWLRHRDEPVDLPDFESHFVLPQRLGADRVSDEWRADLGNAAVDIHKNWVNRPGNITLVLEDAVSALDDVPFIVKCERLGRSEWKLNRFFQNPGLLTWNEDAMRRRGRELAHLVTEAWPGP